MPEATARDTLLVAIDASLKAIDYPFMQHPAKALSALVVRTLDERPDLTAPTRSLLLRGVTFLLDTSEMTVPERRMRQAVTQWTTVDRATATFTGQGPSPSSPFQLADRNVDGTLLHFVITFPNGRDGVMQYWVKRPNDASPSPSGWAGPFTMPALGPFDPTP